MSSKPPSFSAWADEMNFTDSTLKSFLSDVDSGKKKIGDLETYITSAGKSTISFKGILKSTGSFLKTTGSILASMGTAFLVMEGISFALKVLDDHTHQYTRALENASTAADEYVAQKSNVQALTSEYDTLQSKIKELQALQSNGTITMQQEIELANLQNQSAELERQLDIQKQILDAKAKASADAAMAASQEEMSFLEMNQEKHGKFKGIWKAFTGLFDTGINGDYQSEWEKWKEDNTTQVGLVKSNISELESLNAELNTTREKLAKDANNEKLQKKEADLLEDITSTKTDLASEIETVQSWIDQSVDENGIPLKGYESFVESLRDIVTEYQNIGKSVNEIDLNNLNNHFSSTSGKAMKDYLTGVVKESKNAKDALKAFEDTGMSLEELGVTESGFIRYFEDVVRSANEAKEAINSVDGSFEGVTDAFKSENQGIKWDAMASNIAKAKELIQQGLVGTDDFQTVAKWMSPDVINEDDYEYDADAYVAAWQNAYDKVSRWFDSENPLQSMHNFVQDLSSNGIANITYDANGALMEVIPTFKNTAEAADKLGVSVNAVETAMSKLEEYGFEFDGIMYSGEGLENYKNSLEGIRSVYESLDSGREKYRLGRLIENWDQEYAKYEGDLSQLTEDQVVKIKFEYDMASLLSEIEKLDDEWKNGNNSAEVGASRIASRNQYRELREDNNKFDESSDTGYAKTYEIIESLQSKMHDANVTQKQDLQEQIVAIQDLQIAFQDMFSDGKVGNWDDFIKIDSFKGIMEEIAEQANISVKELYDLLNLEMPEPKVEVDADTSKAEEKINKVNSFEFSEKIALLTANDNATPYLKIWNELQADPKFTELNAADQATYVIAVWNSLTPEQKQAYMNGEITITDEATGTIQTVDGALNALPMNPQPKITATENATSVAASAALALNSINGKTAHTYIITHKSETGGGKSKLSGTAHLNGTMNGLYPIPQLSGRALAMGTLQDESWLKPNWRTDKSEVALTGEEGQELVVTRANRWFTVGDNGAEFASIPQGSIVFDAKQTKELLSKGRINSRGTAMISGTAFATGGRLPIPGTGGYGNGGSNYAPSYSSPPQPTQNQTANSIDKATDSAEEFSEELDYIEIKLDRIEREISNIEIIADSAFETFSTRNKALGEQISATTSEIAIQQAAYERYMQAANSVGLSEDYASKVHDGLIDLETITDKTLKENIDDYQKWYEKALDCRDAVNELKESVRELYQQQFDNVVDEFDNILGVIEHRKNILEGYIDLTEAQGYLTSTKYYDALISHEQNSLKELESERKALIGELNNAMSNGNIQMYSEAWYEMQNDINDVNESILEANQNIVDFKNSIQEIQWDVFDKLQERISGIADESDFLTDLMSSETLFDDTGNITEFGKATMGLHGVNYNTYMSQADEYRKEMEKIQKELESDPYNETLIERRKELLELQQESILAAEDEKDAIRDLVEEGIELQLDSLKELIEKYENALDSQKDLYDYQNQIAEKQQEIASLEKQMIAYAGDDSEEGNAKKQEIQNQLDEARKDLEETQFDRAISEQKKLLDELYTEYEEVLNLRLDNIDMLVTDVINNVNAESSAIRDTIISKADSVGYQITDTMATILGEGGSVVGTLIKYGDGFTTIMTNVQIAINDIKNLLKESMGYSDNVAEENINASNQQQAEQTTPSSTPSAPALSPEPQTPQGNGTPDIGDAVTFNHGMYYYSSDGLNPSGNELLGQTVYITHINNASWAKKPYHIARDKEGTRPLGWLSLDQISGYKSGTRSVPKDDYYWTNEEGSEMVLHRKGDGAILRGLGRGDVVFNKHATDNMYAMANDPADFINGYINATTPNIAPINKVSSTENTVNVEVKIDKVMDYDDFLRQMQNDKKFERMIHAMTFDQVLGKGKMTKYNIRI